MLYEGAACRILEELVAMSARGVIETCWYLFLQRTYLADANNPPLNFLTNASSRLNVFAIGPIIDIAVRFLVSLWSLMLVWFSVFLI
jgi:hypothetical protein